MGYISTPFFRFDTRRSGVFCVWIPLGAEFYILSPELWPVKPVVHQHRSRPILLLSNRIQLNPAPGSCLLLRSLEHIFIFMKHPLCRYTTFCDQEVFYRNDPLLSKS